MKENAEITRKFFEATDEKTKDLILSSIAVHYGITKKEALEEVLDENAEHLLDYLAGSQRNAVYIIMQRHGFTF
jgi:hypothetical protein